ncbi:MAG: shikimate kinase [Lachnospiraceae bacterium]|jgi:Shikimate kinase|nr:shikimate kinase [Lachnospiraceae bacterium]MCX4319186.1 shikimate kinase [Lachnospiraceae bacterium]
MIQGNIFLIGFMGTGKSTVSKELKKMLSMECMEMDDMIVERQGMPISDIFEKYGEDYFRDIESGLLVELKEKNNVIVSCGGGVVLRRENIGHMKDSGRVVLLSATPQTVYDRVKNTTSRPVLNGNMNVGYIGELMEKRREKYEKAADIVIVTDGKSTKEVCREIVDALEK